MRTGVDAFVHARDGVRLGIRSIGRGEPVLLLHELFCDSSGFDPLVAHLSPRWRCITFNARGFPPSEVPDGREKYSPEISCFDLFDTMDRLGVEHSHVVGVSMGASCALSAAMRAPHRFRSLVLVSIGTGSMMPAQEQADAMERLAAAVESSPLPALREHVLNAPNRRSLQNAVDGRSVFEEQFLRLSRAGIAATIRGVQKRRPSLLSSEDGLRQLNIPTLVICGGEDPACLDPSRFLTRVLPDSGLHILPGRGHALYLEDPQTLARLCDALFRR